MKKRIDRRWIFLLILVGVTVPLLLPFGLSIDVSSNVQMVYDLVNTTPPGQRILLSFDFDPSSKPELLPAAEAMFRHAIEKELRIVCVALWPMGVNMAEEIYQKLESQLEYGQNFINLGYTAGGIVSIQQMGRDFLTVYPTDMNGDPISQYPIMNQVKNFEDFAFVASFSTGVPGMKEWIMSAGDGFKLPVTGAVAAVSAPGFLPYINDQKQLHGLIGGLKAAAEYEKLINAPGTATAGMDAQSIAHLIIIIFIIIGNIFWHIEKITEKKGEHHA